MAWAKLRRLIETDPEAALRKVDAAESAWNRSIGYAWVARFTPGDPIPVAFAAANAASDGKDAYQRSASRAWEIAALVERGFRTRARVSLEDAAEVADTAEPVGSRAEALLLLLAAAARIDPAAAWTVAERIVRGAGDQSHWRFKRAVWSTAGILAGIDAAAAADFVSMNPPGKLRDRSRKEAARPCPPRPFFW